MAPFVLVVLTVCVLVLLSLLSSVGGRRTELRRLIESLRGRSLKQAGEPVDLEGQIAVPFRMSGRNARLLLPASSGRTVVEVGENGFGGRSLHVFGSRGHDSDSEEDRDVGDPAFDRSWTVQGDLAGRVFAPESRAWCVAAIHALGKYVDPCVEIRKGLLRVSVDQPPESVQTVRRLLQAAEAVLEAAGSRVSEGILWIAVKQGAASVCQVCGTDEAGSRVVCRSCRTPHHADCWTYAGRCSTYGCGETACRPA